MSNINLIFIFKGNKITLQCQVTEKLKDVFQRFASKIEKDVKDLEFYFNSMRLVPCDKTLFNLQIKSFSEINAVATDVTGA